MFQIDTEQKKQFQQWASPKLKVGLVAFFEKLLPELSAQPKLLGPMADYAYQIATQFAFESEVNIFAFAGLMLEVGPNFYQQEILYRSLQIYKYDAKNEQDHDDFANHTDDMDDEDNDTRIQDSLFNCANQAWIQAFALRDLNLWFGNNEDQVQILNKLLEERKGHPLARIMRMWFIAQQLANGDVVTAEEKADTFSPIPITDPIRDPLGRTVNRYSVNVQNINPVTGELSIELDDFKIPGSLALKWTRKYRSSHVRDTALGIAWTYPGFEHLYVYDTRVEYVDRNAQVIPFNLAHEEAEAYNLHAKIRLFKDEEGYHLLKKNGLEYLFQDDSEKKKIRSIKDKFGNAQTFNYDENGRLISIEVGRLNLLFQYDKNYRFSVLMLSTGDTQALPLVKYSYDRHGNLIEVLHQNGGKEKFRYKNQLLTDQVKRNGLHINFKWGESGPDAHCIFCSAPKKTKARYLKYKKNQTLIQDSRGATHAIEYDSMGNVVSLSDQDGLIVQYVYDHAGYLVQMSNANDEFATYDYNMFGDLIGKTNEAGFRRIWRYDDRDRLVCEIDYTGARFKREYDEKDMLATVSDPLGRRFSISYNPLGLPFVVKNVYGQERILIWDEQGNINEINDHLGTEYFNYNPLGQLMEKQKGQVLTQYSYDRLGNLQEIKMASNRLFQFSHDVGGNITGQIDAGGGQWRFLYDGYDEVVESIDPLGGRIRYSFNEERHLTGIRNENRESCNFVYDHRGRLIQEQGFDGRTRRLAYNKTGSMTQIEDGEHTIDMQYDSLANLIHLKTSDEEEINFDYDAMSRMTLSQSSTIKISREYNSAGDLLEEWQNKNMLRYLYDDTGKKITTWLGDGSEINYAYDDKGRLKSIALREDILIEWNTSDDGAKQSASYLNGVREDYEYDEAGRLICCKVSLEDKEIAKYEYNYDELGRLIKDENNFYGLHEHSYDALGRFMATDGQFPEYYCYDPAGNLLETAQRGNKINAYRCTSFGGFRIEYDDRGNVISLTGSEDGALALEYNSLNQLIEVKGYANCRYQYDCFGRRVLKKDDLGETQFIWDGNMLIQEVINFKAITYIYEPLTHLPIAQIREGELYFCHNDIKGRPILLTDEQGEIAWQGRLNHLSQLIKLDVEICQNNLRQLGHYFDYTTGLHIKGDRYYHPMIGRFLQQKPIRRRKFLNPYAE